MINSRQKALLHVAKAQLRLTNEEYRDILRAHGGAESSKYLDEIGMERVMTFFQSLGFKTKQARRANLRLRASESQIGLIYHLRQNLGWVPKRLYGFILKMTGEDHPERLTKEQASNVIEGLKKMRDRKTVWQ
jgi:hypothetical protein